jgi:hypothetical protein
VIPFLDLKAQYRQIKSEVDAAIARAMDSAQFVLGPEVDAFELNAYDLNKICSTLPEPNGGQPPASDSVPRMSQGPQMSRQQSGIAPHRSSSVAGNLQSLVSQSACSGLIVRIAF